MLFLYALLYFALSNVIVAAPVGSNLDPPTESSNSKPSTPGSVANRRPISAVLLTRPVAPPPYDPYNNAVYNPHNRRTIKQLELEKGSIYFIQVPVSYDDHSRNFRNLIVCDRFQNNLKTRLYPLFTLVPSRNDRGSPLFPFCRYRGRGYGSLESTENVRDGLATRFNVRLLSAKRKEIFNKF